MDNLSKKSNNYQQKVEFDRKYKHLRRWKKRKTIIYYFLNPLVFFNFTKIPPKLTKLTTNKLIQITRSLLNVFATTTGLNSVRDLTALLFSVC